MQKDIVPFTLRIPAEIKAQLDITAAKQQRSINSEIVARLSESLEEDQKRLAEFTVGELVQELIKRNESGRVEIRIVGFNKK